MLTFELLKLLPNKTKVGPGGTTVWDRQSPEILSTINYSMTLGSIIPGAPIAEHTSDPSGSQATSGTGTRLGLGLGQPYRCYPSRDPQETTRYPSRHLTQSSRTSFSGHSGWGPECCSWRKTSKKAALAQGAGQQVLPAPWPLRAKVLLTRGHSPQLLHGTKLGRSKRSLTLPPERGISGLCSQGCRGSAEIRDLSITWEGPCLQETEEGALLLLFPLQAPESITIQWSPLSSGEGRAEPHPNLVLSPIIGKTSREGAPASLILPCPNPFWLRRV